MTTYSSIDIAKQVALELSLPIKNVAAVLALAEEGNTVPFIARYRKEQTGDMDEVAIRQVLERHAYLKEFYERRDFIIETIKSQGKLTDELEEKIMKAESKQELEDLYLPFKPKRRTRAAIAREKGLEPLAMLIMEQPLTGDKVQMAEPYVSNEKGVENVDEAWAGARAIVAEMISEQAEVRSFLRDQFFAKGILHSKVATGKEQEGAKFQQYFDFREPIAKIPSHRYLALRRGEAEEILFLEIELPDEELIATIARMIKLKEKSVLKDEMAMSIDDAYKRLLCPSVETDVRVQLKMEADQAAVKVFADNLHNLLMAAPLGEYSIVGIDPGLRTGCKCAAVTSTGKYLDTVTIYPHTGARNTSDADRDFLSFILKHKPYAIAIGNGTASRETELFVKQALKKQGLDILVVMVSEAGASVYSASDIARQEFPDLDLTIRGAISIARRLQDPLAELVKVDPKSIGVGQYQHDVYQPMLQQKLGEVVESCVNNVGVELNTASAPLLSYVAGIGASVADKIVKHREHNGAFHSRADLLKISGFGPKTFEQAAGFLRVRGAVNPLDASAVHPERYALVEKIASDMGVSTRDLIGNNMLINKIDIKNYISDKVGEPTLRDILSELQKPGRDPRATFEAPSFRQDVLTVEDVKPGMTLEGIITNVTAFGAFVDIGVHQDGLLHISELADHYVKDPSAEVSVGQKVTVKVLEVDYARKRVSLTRKTGSVSGPATASAQKPKAEPSKILPKRTKPSHNPFANL